MPGSDLFKIYQQAVKMIFSVIFCAFFIVWLNHGSINAYYQQKYHESSPLEAWDGFSWWTTGDEITHALTAAKDAFFESWSANKISVRPSSETEDPPVDDKKPEPVPAEKNTSPAAPPLPLAPVEEIKLAEKRVFLKADDVVFFVGDSMMQGVAPHVMSALHKRFAIQSLNLSKQSTGLSYTSLFNWPKVIEETLAQNPHFRLMVVMLGPNDPWAIPVEKGKPYLAFKSAPWDEVYRARVDHVFELAKARGVQVIWVGVPNMRDPKLSDGVRYLNHIYQDEALKFHEIYLSTNDLFGYEHDEFSDSMLIDEKKVKTRSGDGIHFTPTGQRRIAEKVLSRVEVTAQKEPAKE